MEEAVFTVSDYDEHQGEILLSSHPASKLDVAGFPMFGARVEGGKTCSFQIRPDYLMRVSDVTVVPRQILHRNGKLLPDTFRRISSEANHDFLGRDGSRFRSKVSVTATSSISEPAVYLDGEHVDHFGHLTLEVLSRLWFLRSFDERAIKFVTSTKHADRLQVFLQAFGFDARDVIRISEPTRFETLLIPSQSYVLEQQASLNAHWVYGTIANHYAAPRRDHCKRLYVSRRKFAGHRKLVNEEDVERIFASRGFDVIFPEEMPIPQQIERFAAAEIVAGPSGSSMYNCVYAQRARLVIALASKSFVTRNDTLIKTMNGYEGFFITGDALDDAVGGMRSDWVIDEPEIVRQLDRVGL